MDVKNFNCSSEIIDINEPSIDVIQKTTSLKSYSASVLKESTIGIISNIVTVHSKYRKVFKIFLLSLCISGFLYQCITFLNHVLEYPAVVDIAIDRPDSFKRPAYTFCNNYPFSNSDNSFFVRKWGTSGVVPCNCDQDLVIRSMRNSSKSSICKYIYMKYGRFSLYQVIRFRCFLSIKRSVFCSKFPDDCIKPSKEFCDKFSSYCGANETLIPRKKFYEIESWMSYEEILEYGKTLLNDFFVNDRHPVLTYKNKIKVPSGPHLRVKYTASDAMVCYNLYSVLENNQQPVLKEKQVDELNSAVDTLVFYVDETEMMNSNSDPGVFLSVHSPLQAVNPFDKGIFLKGGRTYKIFVELEEEVLLKQPFETNCMDYNELWEKNNYTGPRIQEMCREKCMLEYSLASYNCVIPSVLYPSKEKLCYHTDIGNRSPPKVMKKRKECYKNCQDDCRLTKYTTEVFVRYEVDYIFEENLHRYIIVKIYLSNEEVKVLTHSPKFMTVEVFSSIGGFIGCWLGIALMDILDVFGSIITICRYAYLKKKK